MHRRMGRSTRDSLRRAVGGSRGQKTRESASLGKLVLEIAAREIIPVLVTEFSAQVFGHGARAVPGPAVKRQPPSRSLPAARPQAVRSTTVVSEMPGRVRLQVTGLRGNPTHAAALKKRLLALPGVSQVAVSVLTGKVLVQHDPDRVALRRILATVARPAPAPARQRSQSADSRPLPFVAH